MKSDFRIIHFSPREKPNMKKGIVKIYDEVAPTYELINHILTFGLDLIWRKRTARMAAKIGRSRLLDVCCGTGELARNIAALAREKTELYGVDGSFTMIFHAKNKKHLGNVHFTIAEAGSLPFPDHSFDLITISFSARNLNPDPQAMLSYLREFCRILKPGGNFINLETSQPPLKFIKKLYHLYIRLVIKPVGYFISGSRAGYDYLSYTMPRFYAAPEFSALCLKAGFSKIRHRLLFLGVAAIHSAKKE
ncbi:MAG: ubiquinone/menaquinone biosynthesis methyltransferase [Elusimicrobiota bacterium]